MRPFFEHKRWVVFLSLLGLGALILLSVGLREIPFREAQSFGRNQIRDFRYIPVNVIRSIIEVPFWMQLTVWGIFILMFVLLGLLMTPEWRKRLIRIVIRVAVTYWALFILITRYRDMLVGMGISPAVQNGNTASSSNSTAPPVFASPETISLLSYLVSFALVVLLLYVSWRAYGYWKEISASDSELPLKKIARIARSSIDDLSAGRNSTDVIINCYFRMSDVIANKHKIHRRDAMTPAEFAVQLQNAGLPAEAVQRLTRLFEKVRYGNRRTEPKDVDEAVTCLTTILQYCGEPV